MLRLGLLPTNSSGGFLSESTMTTKGLDTKHRRTFNAEAEVAVGHFLRELTFSSARGCVMFLDAVQQQLKEIWKDSVL